MFVYPKSLCTPRATWAAELRVRRKRCLETSLLVPLPTLLSCLRSASHACSVISEIQVYAAGAETEDENRHLIGCSAIGCSGLPQITLLFQSQLLVPNGLQGIAETKFLISAINFS